ncbi:MAG: class I SAM-dependent methyltransferase [Chlamydiota bacterium]
MTISKFSTAIYSLSNQQVTAYFTSEHAKWCSPDKKIEWMNNWIKNGGSIPDKNEFADPKSANIANDIRKKKLDFWNESGSSPSGIGHLVKKALSTIEKEDDRSPRLAIDLGGGNSNLAILLLTKNWKVVVVDSSPTALHSLQMRISQHGLHSLAEKNLTLICKNMEDYKFPNNVSFITAQASLPYCDPSKIEAVWDKIHDSLIDRGRVTGNFFCYPKNDEDPFSEMSFRLKMSPWFANKPITTALLQNKGYEIEHCSYDDFDTFPGIDFIGRKSK